MFASESQSDVLLIPHDGLPLSSSASGNRGAKRGDQHALRREARSKPMKELPGQVPYVVGGW